MNATGRGEILQLTLISELDVFLARQRGREVAALVAVKPNSV